MLSWHLYGRKTVKPRQMPSLQITNVTHMPEKNIHPPHSHTGMQPGNSHWTSSGESKNWGFAKIQLRFDVISPLLHMRSCDFKCAHHTYKSSSCRDETELINGFGALYYLTCPQQAFYYFHEFYMICHLLWLYIGCEMTWCWKRPSHCVPVLSTLWKHVEWNASFTISDIFCHSSAYSPLMMQNDTKYAALGETYTDFITRYF